MFATAVLRSVFYRINGKYSSFLKLLALIEFIAFIIVSVNMMGRPGEGKTPKVYDYQIEKNINLISTGF